MQVQAAVIQIHRAHRGNAVIHQPGLGVQKARRVAVNFNACPQQMREIAPRQLVDRRLVRHAGRVDAHIDAALGRQPQTGQQVVVQNQVRRADVQPLLRLVDKLQIHVLRHSLAVHRGVGKGLHQTVRFHRHGGGQIAARVQILVGVFCLPERQKDVCQARCAGAIQPDAAVLPVAEPHDFIDILVRQIHTARKGDLSVDDHDLAVVAVVHDQVQHWHTAVEAERSDAVGPHHLGVVVGQQAQAARVVVDDPHVQPCRGLPAQNLVDLPPHLAHADDKALHINAVLCPLQCGQHIGKHALPVRVIFRRRATADRHRAVVVQVAGRQRGAGVLPLQGRRGVGVVLPRRGHCVLGALQPVAQAQRRALVAPQQVQNAALHRHNGKQDHPADLKLRHRGILPDQRQAHDNAHGNAHAAEPFGVVRQPVEQRKQPERLQQQKHAGHNNAAEHQVQHPAQHQTPVPFFHTNLVYKCKKPHVIPQRTACGRLPFYNYRRSMAAMQSSMDRKVTAQLEPINHRSSPLQTILRISLPWYSVWM